jgi:hypothetical protein
MVRFRSCASLDSLHCRQLTVTRSPFAIWLLMLSATVSPSARPDAISTKIPVIATDGHVLELHDAVAFDDRNLRAAGAEQQRASGDLLEAPRPEMGCDLHVRL